MNLSLERLIFQPSDLASSPTIGSYLIDGSGNLLTSTLVSGKQALDVNIASPIPLSVDLNGIYDVGTNPTPDNAGMILFTRAASIGLAQQVELPTAGSPTADAVVAANVKAADVNGFLMGYNGTTWDRLKSKNGKLQVSEVPSASVLATAVVVGVTAVALPSTPLANRSRLQIQNKGNKSIFVGSSAVLTSSGIEVAPGATESLECTDGVLVYAISGTAGQDVRVLELA